jgi:nitrate/nitrite transporter NarK
MLRSGVGVVVGYLVFAVSAVALFALTGREAHAAQDLPFMILCTVYGMAFAFLGGYLAGRIAGRREGVVGAALATVIALGALSSIPSVPKGTIPWTQLAALVFMAPCAILGGMVRRGQRGKAVETDPGRDSLENEGALHDAQRMD